VARLGGARADYETARARYSANDFAGAAERFQRVYEATRDPSVLLLLAASERRIERHVAVANRVEQYLRESGSAADAQDRSDAHALLTSVEPLIGTISFDVDPAGARVEVDDHRIGTSPLPEPVRVKAGERRIRVTKPGYSEFTRTELVEPGTTAGVSAVLVPTSGSAVLAVFAGTGDTISIDGHRRGTSKWTGNLSVGLHTIDVSAPGKRPLRREIMLNEHANESVLVVLEPDAAPPRTDAREQRTSPWLWIAGGAAVAVGLAIGGYFLFRSDDGPPVAGTMDTVELPLGARF
jgi:hypothetical protein